MATFRIEDLANATAYDSNGDKLGSIKDVYLDDNSGQPDFVDVNHGLFGMSNSIVPLRGHQLRDGELHLAFTKDRIKDAPNLNTDGHLTPEDQSHFYRHYGVDTADNTTNYEPHPDDRDRFDNRDGLRDGDRFDSRGNLHDGDRLDHRNGSDFAERDRFDDRDHDGHDIADRAASQNSGYTEVRDTENSHVHDDKFGGFAGAGAAAGGVGAAGAVRNNDPHYDDNVAGRGTAGIDNRRNAHEFSDQDSAANDRIVANVGRNADYQDRDFNDRDDRRDRDFDRDNAERGEPGPIQRDGQGEYRLRKYTVRETRTVEVPVEREEVRVERIDGSDNDLRDDRR